MNSRDHGKESERRPPRAQEADEDFDALLDACSLGAPIVEGIRRLTPDDVREELHARLREREEEEQQTNVDDAVLALIRWSVADAEQDAPADCGPPMAVHLEGPDGEVDRWFQSGFRAAGGSRAAFADALRQYAGVAGHSAYRRAMTNLLQELLEHGALVDVREDVADAIYELPIATARRTPAVVWQTCLAVLREADRSDRGTTVGFGRDSVLAGGAHLSGLPPARADTRPRRTGDGAGGRQVWSSVADPPQRRGRDARDWTPLPRELDPELRQFAERLRMLKDSTGLSLDALAERTACSPFHWERYLNGTTFPPRQAVQRLGLVAGADGAGVTKQWELAERVWRRLKRETRKEEPPEPEPRGSVIQASGRSADEGELTPPLRRGVPRPAAAILALITLVIVTGLGLFARNVYLAGQATPALAETSAPVADPASHKAPRVRCVGADCEGEDPLAMGCDQDSMMTSAILSDAAYVETRYSTNCKAAWGQLRWSDAHGVAWVISGRHRSKEQRVIGNKVTYTPMVWAEEPAQAKVCAKTKRGRKVCTLGDAIPLADVRANRSKPRGMRQWAADSSLALDHRLLSASARQRDRAGTLELTR